MIIKAEYFLHLIKRYKTLLFPLPGRLIFIPLTLLLPWLLSAQEMTTAGISINGGLEVISFNGKILPRSLPLVSFAIDTSAFHSGMCRLSNGKYHLPGEIELEYLNIPYDLGIKSRITFRNISGDTLFLHNVVPFGISEDHVYITGKGDHPLSRSHLFRPG